MLQAQCYAYVKIKLSIDFPYSLFCEKFSEYFSERMSAVRDVSYFITICQNYKISRKILTFLKIISSQLYA